MVERPWYELVTIQVKRVVNKRFMIKSSLMKEKGLRPNARKKIIRCLFMMHLFIFPLYDYANVFVMIRMYVQK